MSSNMYVPIRGAWIPFLLLVMLALIGVGVTSGYSGDVTRGVVGGAPGHMEPSAHHGGDASPMAAATPGPDADPFEWEMARDMAKMMQDMHAPGYTGDRDVDFLAMMIPHHQGAIDMARLVLIHGQDPLTRDLAADIIAAQQAEIEAMKGRLAKLRNPATIVGEQAYPALSGTRGGPAELR